MNVLRNLKKRGRLVAIATLAALTLTMFAGCSSSADNSEADAEETTTAETTESSTESTNDSSADEESDSEAEAESDGGYEDLTGSVVIYTSIYEDVIEMLEDKMEEVFPNADIEFFYGGTGTIQSKVVAEMESGGLDCDMLMVAEPSYALELMELDMLHPVEISNADELAFDYDPDGYWYPVRVSNMALAYNPELYSADELPSSFYDFAYDTEVAGMTSMGNPLTSGTTLASVTALRDTYGYDYYGALGAQNVMVESGSVALTKLETGECSMIMILEESVLKVREEDDSMIEVVYPEDGTIVIPSPIMTINDDWSANGNTELCAAITEWFLSAEGQECIVAGWMHSVLADFGSYPYDSMPTEDILQNSMEVNWENCYRDREEIRTMFEEAVAIPEE